MALTPEQRIALIQTYAPILLLHPDERFVPVRPERFLRASALWNGNQTGNKDGWGLGAPGFPRQPLIPRAGISLKPEDDFEGLKDVDGDGVGEWYLGHHDPQKGIDTYLRSIEATNGGSIVPGGAMGTR